MRLYDPAKMIWCCFAVFCIAWCYQYYNGVIKNAMMSQITDVSMVYSTVWRRKSKKHQGSTTLAFVRGINRWPVRCFSMATFSNFLASTAQRTCNAGKIFHLMTSWAWRPCAQSGFSLTLPIYLIMWLTDLLRYILQCLLPKCVSYYLSENKLI